MISEAPTHAQIQVMGLRQNPENNALVRDYSCELLHALASTTSPR
jgi:hypothetical protein